MLQVVVIGYLIGFLAKPGLPMPVLRIPEGHESLHGAPLEPLVLPQLARQPGVPGRRNKCLCTAKASAGDPLWVPLKALFLLPCHPLSLVLTSFATGVNKQKISVSLHVLISRVQQKVSGSWDTELRVGTRRVRQIDGMGYGGGGVIRQVVKRTAGNH
jgi:hypothetical protein